MPAACRWKRFFFPSLRRRPSRQLQPQLARRNERKPCAACSNLERSTISPSESPSRVPSSTKDTATDGGIRSRRLRRDFVVFSGRSKRRYSLQSPGKHHEIATEASRTN